MPSGDVNGILSAKITSNQPVVAVVNQSTLDGLHGKTYNAAANGGTTVILPGVLNYWGYEGWVSSVNIQNVGAATTDVTLTYNNVPYSQSLAVNGLASIYIPSKWQWGTTPIQGYAIVTSSNSPVAVVVNHGSLWYTSTDMDRSYNGIVR